MHPVRRFPAALSAGAIVSATFVAFSVTACDDSPAAPAAAPVARADEGGATPPAVAQASAAGLTLPYHGTVTWGGFGFMVDQYGNGGAGSFAIRSSTGWGTAVTGRTSGMGNAGVFQVSNSASSAVALHAHHFGKGIAIAGFTNGSGSAGAFSIANRTNTKPALAAETSGMGPGGFFDITNTGGTGAAVHGRTAGIGPALLADQAGGSGPLALFQSNGVTQIRFTKNGRGHFNGGTQASGADVAEAFEVEGAVAEYAPGDVLVISTENDRRVVRSSEPYSTRVIGVYATKPGVLLTERSIDDSLDDTVPVGVVGVIPTRVTAENGPIRRGDLLTTSATPGHAMKAAPIVVNGVRFHAAGVILGKALEEFDGRGSGLIRVLVNVK